MIAPRVDTAERPRVREQVHHQAPPALDDPVGEPLLVSEVLPGAVLPDAAGPSAAGSSAGGSSAGGSSAGGSSAGGSSAGGSSAGGTLTHVETLPAVESFVLTVLPAGDALAIDGRPVPHVGVRATRRAIRARTLRRRRQYAAAGVALLVGTFGATVAVLDLVH